VGAVFLRNQESVVGLEEIADQYVSVSNAITLHHLQKCDRKPYFNSVLMDREFRREYANQYETLLRGINAKSFLIISVFRVVYEKFQYNL
jgi:hypothetical protein